MADTSPRAASAPTDPLVIDDLHLGQSHIIATHVFLGAEPFLVDPGPASTLENLEAGLAGHGLGLGDIRHILLTHIHLDHAGAAGTLVERHPHIHVYVHARGAPHIIDPSRLMTSAARLYGDQMERLWGEMRPIPVAKMTVLTGGETLHLGERSVRCFDAPGHARHHIVYLDELSGAACVGDNGGIRLPGYSYISPATPPPEIEVEVWLKTLQLIAGLAPRMLLLTHFGRYDDPQEHLAAYGEQLQRWAEVVRVSLERGEDEVVRRERLLELERAALSDPGDLARYQQASPVVLNEAGLARYWRKRSEAAQGQQP